ncbi:MAG: hypothetical protein AVDCRST_MAG93-8574 [uncultured Chloroflexia bacterium]|uniref:PKD domain-containing protein n=1 Tax=uncultured Chloroflexia bacterium TaxID=1672391 RepID=A0A6J4N2E6_9CHLR|nr:MAG: hypothetical protein AVDCRST_MAG93-8574 [uncultured Chloroflexia bacterium]
MMIKRFLIGGLAVLALAACGPGDMTSQANEAAATVAARMGDLATTAESLANDPTAQALAGQVSATIEAAAADPTAAALANEALATAEAVAEDPTAQALANEALATAEAAAEDPTALALANDPTAQALAEEALATAEAMANDPTAQAEALTAVASVDEGDVQAALDEAFADMDDTMTLTEGQDLSFDALSGIANVTNYRMTIVDAPTGAEASEGEVIKEASDGNISVTPEEYEQYFTTPGDYTVRLDLTSNGQNATNEFTITVP